jgi:flagellar hook assembly protein FlgD
MTEGLDLGLPAGTEITASYVDPSDSRDTSSDKVKIVATVLTVDRFYASPTPFADVVTFAYEGSGLARQFSVSVYDLTGRLVWSTTQEDVLNVVWNGRNEKGRQMANGAYIYSVIASNGDRVFTDKGKVFLLR